MGRGKVKKENEQKKGKEKEEEKQQINVTTPPPAPIQKWGVGEKRGLEESRARTRTTQEGDEWMMEPRGVRERKERHINRQLTTRKEYGGERVQTESATKTRKETQPSPLYPPPPFTCEFDKLD